MSTIDALMAGVSDFVITVTDGGNPKQHEFLLVALDTWDDRLGVYGPFANIDEVKTSLGENNLSLEGASILVRVDENAEWLELPYDVYSKGCGDRCRCIWWKLDRDELAKHLDNPAMLGDAGSVLSHITEKFGTVEQAIAMTKAKRDED